MRLVTHFEIRFFTLLLYVDPITGNNSIQKVSKVYQDLGAERSEFCAAGSRTVSV
jgi:hypothetical protein